MSDYLPSLSSVSTVIGMVGGTVSGLFGGWDGFLQALILFMAVDWILGVVNACVFKKSTKTASGGYSSDVGFKGLVKKCVILVMILIAAGIDTLLGVSVVRDAVCIAYIANELASILETIGQMGVPIPSVIEKAIDILQAKGDDTSGLQ